MERLQCLTGRQLDTLQLVARWETPDRGVPLQRLARGLRIRPPSALGHLAALEATRLVARRSGKTRLTAAGRRCLEEYVRHHRVAESLFVRVGLSVRDACSAAREVDLALSHRTVDRLCRAEGHPAACPHGEPIAPCRRVGSGRTP